MCFLALGCKLRSDTADTTGARLGVGLGLGLRLGRIDPLNTESTMRVVCAYMRLEYYPHTLRAICRDMALSYDGGNYGPPSPMPASHTSSTTTEDSGSLISLRRRDGEIVASYSSVRHIIDSS